MLTFAPLCHLSIKGHRLQPPAPRGTGATQQPSVPLQAAPSPALDRQTSTSSLLLTLGLNLPLTPCLPVAHLSQTLTLPQRPRPASLSVFSSSRVDLLLAFPLQAFSTSD